MTLRLPRLPETAEIVEANRRPSFKFQRWWQSIVSKLEAQEATQDQMLEDIATALEQAGIALDLAGAIMPDIPPVTVQADYTGAVLSGQLPRNIAAQRFAGDTDVTTSAEWSATTVSGGATYTIGAATGILNLTALASTAIIEITSEYDGISRSKKLTITKQLQDPPQASGSTTEYDSSITETTADAYGAANAGPLTVTCGASGEIELSAPLSFAPTADGTFQAYGKWQISAAGAGVWTDVDTEILSSVSARQNATLGLFEEGAIAVNQTATGLTPASDYDLQLLLRNASGTDTLYYAGTATAATS